MDFDPDPNSRDNPVFDGGELSVETEGKHRSEHRNSESSIVSKKNTNSETSSDDVYGSSTVFAGLVLLTSYISILWLIDFMRLRF